MNVAFKLKQLLFWVGYRMDQRLPLRLCVALRNRCMPWGGPILDVVEIHIVDHCNLNCTGCLHFSPLAKKWFADAGRIERDLLALRRKFRYIRHVTLLGGEPLLHPEYERIVERVKRASPESLITIVTNGVALKGDSLDRFLDVCKKHGVRVKWTVYPPLRNRRDELVAAFRSAGVPMFTVEVGEHDFYVKMRPCGGDAAKSMRLCRKMTYCPYLRDGRLYTCAQAYHIKDYIKLYETETGNQGKMTASAGLDVHDEANDGWTILKYLMTPCETCRFCADRVRGIPWTQGFRSVRDWEVG